MQTMCPHCGGKGKIKEEWIGKKIKCPKCSTVFEVEPLETPEAAASTPNATVENSGNDGATPAPENPTPTPTSACSQCGVPTPESDLLDFDGTLVCARCKSTYLQKIREGVTDADFQYGGFWVRFVAKFIDTVITGFISFLIGFIVVFLTPAGSNAQVIAGLGNNIFGFVLGIAYVTWFVGKYSATPGKMALGLKIVKPDGAQLTYMQAFGRYWAELLSGIILAIGYIMAAFDDEKRALHDRICQTRVIRGR